MGKLKVVTLASLISNPEPSSYYYTTLVAENFAGINFRVSKKKKGKYSTKTFAFGDFLEQISWKNNSK